jgi:DNA-binding SARP family transcriptional activator
MLRLHLFGPLAYTRRTPELPEATPTPLRGRSRSLMAYLALARGRYFTRQQLIDELWAGESEEVSAGTLNTVLWRLRKLIEAPPLKHGELIACDRRGGIALRNEAPIELDIDEFARYVLPVLSKPLERMTEADLEALRCGIGLYTADILTDIGDEWALREREKYRRHYLNALGRLMQAAALGHDYPAAIRYAQLILDQDMLREDVHRELMRLFVQGGQRALALRQFEVCRAALKRELAIMPMPETMTLYQSIARAALERDSAALVLPDPSASLPVTLAPNLSARERVQRAREHLVEADEQLQQVLPRL